VNPTPLSRYSTPRTGRARVAVKTTRVPELYGLVARFGVVMLLALGLLVAHADKVFSRGAPDSFADLAESVSHAVVNITTATVVAGGEAPAPMVPEGSPLEDFFRDFMDRQGEGDRRRRSSALGSGFVISEDGFIVTNNHVIESADEITIEFFSGEKLEATVVGRDPNTDIAVLKVEAEKPLQFVPFGDSDIARVGDWVMAVGNPLGQGFSVSAGIISARNRELSGSYDDFIQTDAAINRGNSGGPLFNMDGEVIGVNTAILSPNGGSIGIGFSMSANVVKAVVTQLQEFGETRRGWLGVRIQDVTEDVAEALDLDEAKGALVTDVPDGPAQEAGILAGDVIQSFDSKDITDTRELVRIVGATPVGKAVRVVVFREGKTQTLLVTLGRREEAEGSMTPDTEDQTEEPAPEESSMLGLTVSELTDALRADMNLSDADEGLIVTAVEEDSNAYEKGLRAGDLITEAGQKKVVTPDELKALIDEGREGGRKSLLLLVRRNGDPRFLALSLTE